MGHTHVQPALPVRIPRHGIPGALHAAEARFRRAVLRRQRPAESGERAARVVQADGGVLHERAGRHSRHAAGLEEGSAGGEARGDIPAGGQSRPGVCHVGRQAGRDGSKSDIGVAL